MPTAQTLRRVPWTCRWGQFGGPVTPAGPPVSTAVFWVCDRPQGRAGPRPLHRSACEECPNWEPIEWDTTPAGTWR
jgi:hypothetical protein